jgi:hypothetical protein
MPFCSTCGAEVPADKKFCVECGAPLEPYDPSAVPATPHVPVVTVSTPPPAGIPPASSKKPAAPMIIGGIVAILVIIAIVYFVGMPMLTAGPKSPVEVTQTPLPTVLKTPMQTIMPTPELTTAVPETPALPVQVRDARLEEDYEQIYSLDQPFAFGQKVNFAHVLTNPPLYIRFNLTPTQIIRHRLVSIGTNNEHYENTTENSPNSWFEVTVLDAESNAVIDQQGYGKDYSDITKQDFMVRNKGNYLVVMSGHDVKADIQILKGTS